MAGLLSAWRDWSERRQILRDMRRQQADRFEKQRFNVKDQLTYAMQALERGDLREASEIWSKLMLHEASVANASPLALKVLIGLQLYDDAENLMRAGQKKHPTDPTYVKGLAEVAQSRHDTPAAIERWGALRKRFPGVVEGYTHGADAHLEAGQLREAEALALEAARRFPENIGGPLAYARIAVREKQWEEALERWKPVREKFNFVGGYTGGAEALCQLGRFEEAEALLNEGRLRFSNETSLHYELARVAERRGDKAEAIKLWKSTVYRFPLDINAHYVAADAFEKLGEGAEAEGTLRAAIDRFPTELRPLLELARLQHHRHHDFAAAAETWATIRRVVPDTEEAYLNGADALRRAGRTEDADIVLSAHRQRFRKT